MTYCVAMLLDAGLVFLSDSRTNAGVDQINTFRKTTVFERPGDRVIVLMSAGNLAITQGVLNLLAERMSAQTEANLLNCPNLFEAARCVGSAMREMHQRDAEALRAAGHRVQRLVHPRRADQGRDAAPVPHLRRRQLRRGHAGHHLFPDRRVEVRQADHRSRDPPQHAA